MNLPVTVTKKILFDNLQGIQYIRGTLHMKDNLYISALTFFSNLIGINGATFVNMPILVDARMPSLTQLRDAVTVEGCDRLCPARYTSVGVSLDDSGCTNPEMFYFLRVVGNFHSSDLLLLSSVMARVVSGKTDGLVWYLDNGVIIS